MRLCVPLLAGLLLAPSTVGRADEALTAADFFNLSPLCRADEQVALANARAVFFELVDVSPAQKTYGAVVASVRKSDMACFGRRVAKARAHVVHAAVAHYKCTRQGCNPLSLEQLTAYAERDFLRAGWFHR